MFRRLLSVVAALAASALAEPQPPPPAPPPAEFTGELLLVRYDMPRGLSDGYAPTRQVAKRKEGPDAVDWPSITFDGRAIFTKASTERVPLKLRRGSDAKSPFRLTDDDWIQPGEHWFRPILWPANRKHLYTADPTARCSSTGIDNLGTYELWLFPLRIQGEGAPQVKNVILKYAGGVIFQKEGPWRSLTLLLPANDPGNPYELTIDGRGPLKCNVGLAPVKLGNPVERPLAVDLRVPGDGPKVRVYTPPRPEEFPNLREWNADVTAAPKFTLPDRTKTEPFALRDRYSPFTIYAAALPHGLSGGFWKKGMKPEDYAGQVGRLGFDAVYEPVAALPSPADAESLETRAAALAKHGVRLGLQYDQSWTRPDLQHPNLALFAHTLPDWHQPLYRSLQLTAQRFVRIPGFLGIMIGGDHAGYTSLSPQLGPNPDRPWGEAMQAFLGGRNPVVPRGPSLGPVELPFEQSVKSELEFSKYVERYDTAFRQYGYFAESVRDVNPGLSFTTASFGSSPGAGARGGWPWASLPGRMMFEGLSLQQAFDAGTTHSSKPMHLVALVDRLRSYRPTVPTWALVDNYKLFFGREAMGRAYALALTRGVRGIGTNFLATAGTEDLRPELVTAQRELHTWIHRYGPVYTATEPDAAVGVFFGALQAVQRRVDTRENPPAEELLRDSHEGKVTEALWLCQAAGWPARVVTHQELLRGPLPTSMKALLLVGLPGTDPNNLWSKGLDPMLEQFVARGGRILVDDESVSPVSATKTDLQVAAYLPQSELDPTPRLLERNQENIQKLRTAMQGVIPPVATSSDPLAWTVPTRVRETQYVTALNWAFAQGDEARTLVRPADPRASKPEVWKTKANASLFVQPRTASLQWNSTRPIYDVRQQRRLTPEEAAQVDFTKDAFQWYALPPAEIASIALVSPEPGRVQADVKDASGKPMRGIPVELTLFRDEVILTKLSILSSEPSVVSGALLARGANRIAATELLSGMPAEPIAIEAPAPPTAAPKDTALEKFIKRKQTPLTVALTPAQEKDAALMDVARQTVKRFERAGRKVQLGRVAPGGIVESLQPTRSPHRYPQWKTSPTDVVLFGLPQDNVLILDQVRGEIFPRDFREPLPAQYRAVLTKSPFAGECDVLNVVTRDTAGAQAWLAGWH